MKKILSLAAATLMLAAVCSCNNNPQDTDEAKKVTEAAQVSLEQARKEAEKQLRTEVGDLALQIAEKVIRRNIANDDAQRALVEQYLSEVETKN